MKLLHVIGSMNPVSGGPCQGIRNSNKELQLFGVEREAVSLDDPHSAFLGTDDFPTHAMGPTKTAWQYSPRLYPWLVTNLEYFDVVIINGLWLCHSYAVYKLMLKLRKRAQKPGSRSKVPRLYIMPHGMLDPYFQRARGRRIKAVRNWLYWHLIEKYVVASADALLFTCEREKQLARQSFTQYHPKKEINVGYGIAAPPAYTPDMTAEFEKICPELKGQRYLLFLSRIHTKKGVDMLINAYGKVVGMLPKGVTLPKLVIAGPGLDSFFGRKLKRRVNEDELLKAQIIFPGMLTGNAKWGALYGCHAFVLPSHQENFGIAIVEAMACAKPVLITKEVNIYLEIEAAAGGIVADDTEAGTYELLDSFFKLTPSQQAQMGQNALRAFKTHFDIKTASKVFLDAITKYD